MASLRFSLALCANFQKDVKSCTHTERGGGTLSFSLQQNTIICRCPFLGENILFDPCYRNTGLAQRFKPFKNGFMSVLFLTRSFVICILCKA